MDNNTFGENNNPMENDANVAMENDANVATENVPQFVEQKIDQSSFQNGNYGQEAIQSQQFADSLYQQVPGFEQQLQANMGPGYNLNGQQMGASGKKMKKKKVKKPWSKGKIAAVAGGGAVAVAGIACAVIFLIVPLFKPPKDIVVDAFENTFIVDTTNTYINETFAPSDLINNYLVNGGSFDANVTIDGITIDEEDIEIENISLSANGNYNPKQKYLDNLVQLLYANEDVLSVSLVGDENNTYFGVPSVMDGTYIKLPNKDILNSLANSYLGVIMDMSNLPVVNINYFPEIDPAQDYSLPIDANIVKALEELWDNIEVEKDGKEKIELFGETVKTKKYKVILKEENIEEALGYVVDWAVEQVMANPSILDQAGISPSEFSMYAPMIDSYIPMLVTGDLTFDVYIADEKVVRIATEDKISVSGFSLDYDFCFDLYDGNASVDLTVGSQGLSVNAHCLVKDYENAPSGEFMVSVMGQTVGVKFDTTVDEDATKRNTVFTAKVVGVPELENFTLEATSNYSKTDYNFDGELVISYLLDDIKLTWEGKIAEFEKGKLFDIEVSSIKLIAVNEEVLSASASMRIDTTQIAPPMDMNSCDIYDIADLDLAGFQNMLLDHQDELMDFINTITDSPLGQLLDLGTSEDPNSDPDDPDEPDDPSIDEDDLALHNEDGEVIVTVSTTFDNLEITYANGEYIDYENQDGTFVEYELIGESVSAAEYMSEAYEGDVVTVSVGSLEVAYVTWTNPAGELQMSSAAQIKDGYLLTLSAIITDESIVSVDYLINEGYNSDNLEIAR